MDVADEGGLVAAGADLAPGTLLRAYRLGCFPMPIDDGELVGWWSPDPRAVLEPGDLVVSRSLRRSIRRFEVHIDRDFAAVVSHCADPRRKSGWINEAVFDAYVTLHRLGWAHSVETWADGELVGGLYGVSIGALFAGESMFHLQPDASKVALVTLGGLLAGTTGPLLDVQWQTPHLASLGAHEISRLDYLERLKIAVSQPGPTWPSGRQC
jgi:leucyl/phenylalanyl-tRNA---protein transferase